MAFSTPAPGPEKTWQAFCSKKHGIMGRLLASGRDLAGERKKESCNVRIDLRSRWSEGESGNGTVCFALARGEPGFTFIEVVVAMWLLTLVVVGFYGAFSFGFSTIKLSQEDL